MDAKIKLSGVLVVMLLTACAGQPPAPIKDKEIDTRVREPASQDSAGVQVYLLAKPCGEGTDDGPRRWLQNVPAITDKASGYS